jgi:hypothetical protein
MISRFLFFGVVIVVLALPARAQTGGCSDTPQFSIVPGNPVHLSFAQSTLAILSKPAVSIAGTEITVVQIASDANQYPFSTCNGQMISLGPLPPGSYKVTWKYQKSPSTFFETFHFAFSLADAPPCIGGVTVQPDAPVSDHPVSIAYAAPGLGFVQPPSVTIVGRQISIQQPAAISDRFLGDGGEACARGGVGVGSLEPGLYDVRVYFNFGFIPSLSGSFVVRQDTVTVCGSVPASLYQAVGPENGKPGASVRANGGSLLLLFENRSFAEFVGGGSFLKPLLGVPNVSVDGSLIRVTQSYVPFAPGPIGGAGPGFFALFCQSEAVDLGPLAAGRYTLIWTYRTEKGPVSVTTTFTSTAQRGRAARH